MESQIINVKFANSNRRNLQNTVECILQDQQRNNFYDWQVLIGV